MSFASGRLLSIYALLGAVVLACLPSALALAKLWSNFGNPTYTHGFLLVAIFVWLIFRARHDLAATTSRPSGSACLALAICAVAWLIAWRASLQALHEVLMVAMMALVVPAVFGWQVLRRLSIPLLLLCFALPGWEMLSPLLQLLTAQVVRLLLAACGVDHYVDGLLVYIPEGVFEVASACSGINYLVAGLALAVMLGELHQDTIRTRVGLVALMGGLALVTNWLRVFVIIYMGHLSDMQHPLITSGHYSLGWGIFALAALIFLWIASKVPAPHESVPGPAQEAKQGSFRSVILVMGILAMIPIGLLAASRQSSADSQDAELTLPPGREAWSGPASAANTSWQPIFMGAHASAQGVYTDSAGHEIEAFAVLYLNQRQGGELVGYDNSLSGTQLRLTGRPGTVGSGSQAFREIPVTDANGQRSLIWFAYQVDAERLLSALLVQVRYGVSSFTRQPRSGLMAFRAPCMGSSCDEARGLLQRFTRDMAHHFESPFAYRAKTGLDCERIPSRFVSLFVFRGLPS